MSRQNKKISSFEELANFKLEGDKMVKKNDQEIKTQQERQRSNQNNTEREDKIGEIKQRENIPETMNIKSAPYNFVPINESVVPSEFTEQNYPRHDSFDLNKMNGYLVIEIETKTPLFIRDTLTSTEANELEELDRMIHNSSGDEKGRLEFQKRNIILGHNSFFSPGGKFRIPGSSLRGLVRSTMDIISFGKFKQIEFDKKYHFRAFADRSLNLRTKYANLMIEEKIEKNIPLGYTQQVSAGYLVKRNNEYFIVPAKKTFETQFFRVEEDLVYEEGILANKMYSLSGEQYRENRDYRFGFKEVAFKPEKPQKHVHSKPLYYGKVTEIREIGNRKESDLSGTLVHSGWMRGSRLRPRGKHLHWIVGPIDDLNKKIKIPEIVIQNYRDDINRNENADLLKYFKGNSSMQVPCFYIESNNEIVSFGHTGLFRLAYKYSLRDFIPSANKNFDRLDITSALFGDTENFSSRLFFEDSFIQNEDFLEPKFPQILSAPKPTSFQLYLVQDTFQQRYNNRGDVTGIEGLKDYNDKYKTLLRGNKIYWHRDRQEFADERLAEEKRNLFTTKIKPVKSGVKFSGKIRFENLTNIELGALLFALDLPEGCAHKLGMGKPLGLGSIRITPKLFVSNREERYKNLFSEWNGLTQSDANQIKKLKNEFELYILNNLGENKASLWEVDRLKELKMMLDFNNKPSSNETVYCKINNDDNFKERKVLPLPSEVVKRKA